MSEPYIQSILKRYKNGLQLKQPSLPKTITDPAVSTLLKEYYHVQNVDQAIRHHNESMSCENAIGNFLEHYIANTLLPYGWVRCPGSIVKSIDFIKENIDGSWVALQIKNRSNSENSSSAKVRKNTNIKMWYTSEAYTGKTNWKNFPDEEASKKLNEAGFQKFIIKNLQN